MAGRLCRAAGVGVIGATSLVMVPACAKDESSLFVRAVMVEEQDTCLVEADPTGAFRSSGLMDAKYAHEYSATLLVGNQVVSRGDDARLRTETSRVRLYEVEVSLLDADGGEISAYTTPTSGFVDIGSGSDAGYGLAGAILVDAQTAQSLGDAAHTRGYVQNIVASVIVHGRTLGGNELETPEFHFPISICYGCRCFVPAEAIDPATGVANCSNGTEPDPNCRLGLDAPVDCRLSCARLGLDCAGC